MTAEVDSQEQSLKAFQKKKEEGSLKTDKEKVLHLIQAEQPVTCKQVAELMDKLPHQISGRFTQLKNEDEITEWGTIDGHTLWQIKDEENSPAVKSQEKNGVIWKGDNA